MRIFLYFLIIYILNKIKCSDESDNDLKSQKTTKIIRNTIDPSTLIYDYKTKNGFEIIFYYIHHSILV